jgi:hypothetical protein
VELARELVAVVLQDDTVRRAMELDKLLRAQSPLALVRAVALAESMLQVGELAMRAVRPGEPAWGGNARSDRVTTTQQR